MCEETMMVMPSAQSSLQRVRRGRSAPRDRGREAGSSSMTKPGCGSSPGRSPGAGAGRGSARRPAGRGGRGRSMRSAACSSATHCRGLRHALRGCPVFQALPHGHLVIEAEEIGEIAHAAVGFARVLVNVDALQHARGRQTAGRAPEQTRIRVDLPAPFGPTRAVMVPGAISKLTSSSARRPG